MNDREPEAEKRKDYQKNRERKFTRFMKTLNHRKHLKMLNKTIRKKCERAGNGRAGDFVAGFVRFNSF